MIDDLLLMSGNDIPFQEARLCIHQPSLKEIAYITEEKFWFGCQIIRFDKQMLLQEESAQLENVSNFYIIMGILNNKQQDKGIQKMKINVLLLLSLLFPTGKFLFNETIKIEDEKTHEIGEINQNNFQKFKDILIEMFCLNHKENKEYNPSGDLAKKIADKIKKGRQKKAKLEPKKHQKISFFSRYISILAAAKNKSINEIMGYTIYQLMDEFSRFMLYKNNQDWIRFKIAGATGMKDPEDWLKDIHSQKDNFNKEETLI